MSDVFKYVKGKSIIIVVLTEDMHSLIIYVNGRSYNINESFYLPKYLIAISERMNVPLQGTASLRESSESTGRYGDCQQNFEKKGAC